MNLLDLLRKKQLILVDGAMGTMKMKLGIGTGSEINITNPDAIMRIHEAYLKAGAEIIFTNTFNLNRIYVETHKQNVDINRANKAGVEAARKAAINGQLVLGDFGPTGQMLEPFGNYSEQDFYTNYKEQALALEEAGVDGFVLETMTDLREAMCILKACKDISTKQIIISFAFSKNAKGYTTMMGDTLKDCINAAVENGADVVGTNCGDLEPEEMADAVSIIKSITDLPIAVQPNAGKPKLVNGDTIYDMSPEEFAKGIQSCIDAGASIIGGCCGTTPEHIARLKDILDK